MLGFSILSASIASSAVRDRVTGAKRLQHISGLGYGTYWFANFLYDMVGFGENILPALCQGLPKCVCGGVLFWGRSLQGWPRFQGPRGPKASSLLCRPLFVIPLPLLLTGPSSPAGWAGRVFFWLMVLSPLAHHPLSILSS